MVKGKVPNTMTSGKQDPNHLEIMMPNLKNRKTDCVNV